VSITRRHAILAVVAVFNVAIAAVITPLFSAAAAANALLILLLIKAIVFVALYASRYNWRQTASGRAVMGLIACIATICGIGAVAVFLGNYPVRGFVRIGAFIAVGITLMNMLLTLVDTQRNSNHDDRNDT
jgi:predicted permease